MSAVLTTMLRGGIHLCLGMCLLCYYCTAILRLSHLNHLSPLPLHTPLQAQRGQASGSARRDAVRTSVPRMLSSLTYLLAFQSLDQPPGVSVPVAKADHHHHYLRYYSSSIPLSYDISHSRAQQLSTAFDSINLTSPQPSSRHKLATTLTAHSRY